MVNPRFLVETSNASNEFSTAGITAAWDTISAELTAEMSVSPEPTPFPSFAVFGGPTWYPSAGEPAANGEQGAWAVNLGALASGDYAVTDRAYVVGVVSGSRTLSGDEAIDSYSAAVEIGLQYRF